MGRAEGISKSPQARRLLRGSRNGLPDPGAWTFYDPDHSESEHRFITSGFSGHQRLVFVAHAEQDEETVRIISARKATAREEEQYAKIR